MEIRPGKRWKRRLVAGWGVAGVRIIDLEDARDLRVIEVEIGAKRSVGAHVVVEREVIRLFKHAKSGAKTGIWERFRLPGDAYTGPTCAPTCVPAAFWHAFIAGVDQNGG